MTRKTVSKEQICAIHALLGKMGVVNDRDFKRMLVKQYSDLRVDSTRGLYMDEAAKMIQDLNREVGKPQTATEAAKTNKIKLIYHLCHMMAWEIEVAGKPVVDRGRLDSWCMHYGQFKKPLRKHGSGELTKILVQLEKVYQSFLKGV